MKICWWTWFVGFIVYQACIATAIGGKSGFKPFLNLVNGELHFFQQKEGEIAWNISMGEDSGDLIKNQEMSLAKHDWNVERCEELLKALRVMPATRRESRQIYLLCRGPKLSREQLREAHSLLGKMHQLYGQKEVFAMRMEPDLNDFMETNRQEPSLRAAWMQWFNGVGTEIRPLYEHFVQVLNAGARNAGSPNMGALWRDELEIPNLKSLVFKLYADVKELYVLLHTVVRSRLSKFYGLKLDSTIPAHLLGNMWAQKWDGLMDIFLPDGEIQQENMENPLLEEVFGRKEQNASAIDLVHAAEKFYISMGFPRLPSTFYEKSYFTKDPKHTSKNCHGTAANLFGDHDYRIMMCMPEKGFKDEDLVTLAHEMGHIYYFMAYSGLEPIFQEGANSAFHESVGDAITYGLGGSAQKKSCTDEFMRQHIKMALARIPQIGFGLIMDMWRWYVFENEDKPQTWNAYWWKLHRDFLGISPPIGYSTDGLDAAGKYHVVENIPYIRYFLASFLQMQFFQSFCPGINRMQDCRLHGNHLAGAKLWKMMSRGSSENWSVILKAMTGSGEILSAPLLQYYAPLKAWLERQVIAHNLTVGWW